MDRRKVIAGFAALAGTGAWFRWASATTRGMGVDHVPDPGVMSSNRQQISLVPSPQGDIFINIPIGGGGFVSAGTESRSGNWEICGTDTATSFIRRPGEDWRSCLLEQSIPDMTKHPTVPDTTDGSGSYGQDIADDGTAYTTLRGYLIRSGDAFTGQSRVIFGPKRMRENLGPQRLWNTKLAIDQNNPNRIVIGCMGGGSLGGAYYCLDTSAQRPVFTRITGVPEPINNADHPAPILVATDPNQSEHWALAVLGSGIYLSTSGPGGPYSLSTGSPTTCQDLSYDNHGRLWVVRSAGTVAEPIYHYKNGNWMAAVFPYPADVKTVAIDPLVEDHVIALGPNMEVYRTTKNALNHWAWNSFENNIYPTQQPYQCPRRLWQDTSGSHHEGIFPSRAVFDRAIPNRVNVYHGTGTLYFKPPPTYGGVAYWDTTPGIEQLVANAGFSYAGGDHWLFGWDKGAWKFNDFSKPAARHYPENVGFTHCWDMDVSPSKRVVVMLCNSDQAAGHQTSYSLDKGPFQQFPHQLPQDRKGGCIAAFSDDAFLWVPSRNGQAHYTLDRGKTPWVPLQLGAPMPADGQESGWSTDIYFKKICVVGSKETPGRGWLVNYGPNGRADLGGIWRTDAGPDRGWSRIVAGEIRGFHWLFYHHMTMKEVPGHANFLLISGGPAPDHDEPLLGSRDGGLTWAPIGAGVSGVSDFSFGKPLPGASYPVVRFFGRVHGKTGVYEVTDLDRPKVTLIVEHPAGMVTDSVRAISGDMNVYGKWAYGFGGSGWRGSIKRPKESILPL